MWHLRFEPIPLVKSKRIFHRLKSKKKISLLVKIPDKQQTEVPFSQYFYLLEICFLVSMKTCYAWQPQDCRTSAVGQTHDSNTT